MNLKKEKERQSTALLLGKQQPDRNCKYWLKVVSAPHDFQPQNRKWEEGKKCTLCDFTNFGDNFFSVFRNGAIFSTLSAPENTYLLIGTCWIATWACTHESLCLESRYSIFWWVQLSGCLYDIYVMGNGCSCTVWILETETVQTLVMIINNQQHSEELLHGLGMRAGYTLKNKK